MATSVDDMVLLALSTSTAVTGFATSMFGAVNNFLGIKSSATDAGVSDVASDLDMSDIRVSQDFTEQFERIFTTARAVKKASGLLDDLIQIDKRRVYDLDRIAHFFEKVRNYDVIIIIIS
jgi:hypothetical protein